MQENDKIPPSQVTAPVLPGKPVYGERTLRIVCSVLFFAAVAALGALFTDPSSEWYTGLIKPALQPPAIVFPIVWTVLYILLAASLSIMASDPKTKDRTLCLYVANGLLNVLWSYVFFTRHNPSGALFILIIILILATFLFSDVYNSNKTAAFLYLPYVIWLWFALYLNYEIAFLN